MPQDLVQIALENHRAGRVALAESGYRAALEADPRNADALHWLGVLNVQAGTPTAAVPLLERAVEQRPNDPAFVHNLAQAYLHTHRFEEAIRAFERASTLDSNQPHTLFGLAMAHMARKAPDAAGKAIFYLKQAENAGLTSADLHLNRGIALLVTDRLDEAIESLKKTIGMRGDWALAYYHMSVAYRKKGDLAQTRNWLAATLQIEPEHAAAWHALGVLEAEAGHFDEAEALFRGAIAVRPKFASAYTALASLLEHRGKKDEARKILEDSQVAASAKDATSNARSSADAIAEYDRKLTLSPESAQGQFALAAKFNFAAPTTLPPDTVIDLFDRYADRFDEHLRGKLEYRVPELIAEAAAKGKPDRPLDVLDLGCGTGLCGMLLKPIAGVVWGIDLSPLMVAKSKARGVYDRLEQGDVVQAMQSMDQQFDLVVAGDVFIYVGDLTPVFTQIVRRLRPGGRVIASIEAGGGDRYQMGKKSLRYSHSRPYLQRIAAMFGFEEETCDPITVRIESRKPVAGYLWSVKLRAR
ncbi:MAG TPA: tetratricopeptide repeat protein [Humisphaera sp.]|jgi:predicted TPR repeat methyltransferase|nr:tetratricopeptide repeat protein [Humisphaera sp.]